MVVDVVRIGHHRAAVVGAPARGTHQTATSTSLIVSCCPPVMARSALPHGHSAMKSSSSTSAAARPAAALARHLHDLEPGALERGAGRAQVEAERHGVGDDTGQLAHDHRHPLDPLATETFHHRVDDALGDGELVHGAVSCVDLPAEGTPNAPVVTGGRHRAENGFGRAPAAGAPRPAAEPALDRRLLRAGPVARREQRLGVLASVHGEAGRAERARTAVGPVGGRVGPQVDRVEHGHGGAAEPPAGVAHLLGGQRDDRPPERRAVGRSSSWITPAIGMASSISCQAQAVTAASSSRASSSADAHSLAEPVAHEPARLVGVVHHDEQHPLAEAHRVARRGRQGLFRDDRVGHDDLDVVLHPDRREPVHAGGPVDEARHQVALVPGGPRAVERGRHQRQDDRPRPRPHPGEVVDGQRVPERRPERVRPHPRAARGRAGRAHRGPTRADSE